MTWFKVDDGFWSHPKTLLLSHAAVALWVRAGSYCGKHLTDGHIPRAILPMLHGTPDHARELCNADLWEPVEDGWQFHAWHEYQDTRTEIERRRAAWKNQKRQQRGKHTSSIYPFHSQGSTDSTPDSTTESAPDTTRDKADPNTIAATITQIRQTLRRA